MLQCGQQSREQIWRSREGEASLAGDLICLFLFSLMADFKWNQEGAAGHEKTSEMGCGGDMPSLLPTSSLGTQACITKEMVLGLPGGLCGFHRAWDTVDASYVTATC